MLLDEEGREIGTAAKASVHHRATPLHLGFSCYLFDGARPCAADPARLGQAHLARSVDELVLRPPRPRRTDRPGRAVDAPITNSDCASSGRSVCCQVFGTGPPPLTAPWKTRSARCTARAPTRAVQAASDEVMEWRWVSWNELRRAAELGWPISPWAAKQIPLLETALKAFASG